jgi:hypothetical protein
VGAVGALNLEPFDLAAFVIASCERHGVPVKVTDASVRSHVAVLLTGRAGTGGASACRSGPPVSDSPDEIDSLRIKH